MRSKRKAEKSPTRHETPTEIPNLRRLIDLVALLVVKGDDQPNKIRTLAAVWYSPSEIANLLGTTPNAVSIALYRIRKGVTRRRRRSLRDARAKGPARLVDRS
jgi:hypothetical protein